MNDTELEANLFLDAIVAHMAFLESRDLRTREETHSSFVEAIRVLHEFLCTAESRTSAVRTS
jgi:hypothetical protein